MGVHQARTQLSGDPAPGRTQFRGALSRASYPHPPEVLATPAQLQALKSHADYPSSTSKANLAKADVIHKALIGLGLMPSTLDSSFTQLFSQLSNNQLPPSLVEFAAQPPPPPPPRQAQPQAPQPIYSPVSCAGHACMTDWLPCFLNWWLAVASIGAVCCLAGWFVASHLNPLLHAGQPQASQAARSWVDR